MQPEQINNNTAMCLADNVARVVYAETCAKSLRVVEALCSMIFNQSKQKCKTLQLFWILL